MKKQLQRVLALMLVLVMVSVLGGCKDKTDKETEAPTQGGTSAPVEPETIAPMVKIDDISEYVTLGQYMNLEVVRGDDAITDEDIEAAIKYACESKKGPKKIKEGTVADGDTVGIHYVGTLDGVAFAGGTGDRDLTIGSKTFIDGFESGLIGAKVGETVDLNLTFPEDYHSKDLAGKAVVFTVTINYLCGEVVVPEFDDEMAKELGYKDEAEMREDMLKSLQEAKTASVDGKFGNDVWELAVANAEILKVNQEIYDYYYDSMLAQYEGTAGQYMMTLDEYLKLGGMEKEAFDSMLDKYAIQCMEQELVLRAIVKAESLTVSEDEYQKALNDFYTKYKGQFADAAALEAYYGRERFENELLWNKVIAKVMESGIPVKATGEAATESAQ